MYTGWRIPEVDPASARPAERSRQCLSAGCQRVCLDEAGNQRVVVRIARQQPLQILPARREPLGAEGLTALMNHIGIVAQDVAPSVRRAAHAPVVFLAIATAEGGLIEGSYCIQGVAAQPHAEADAGGKIRIAGRRDALERGADQFGIGGFLQHQLHAPEWVYNQILPAIIIVVTIGILVGALAGYYRGWVEEILLRITEFFQVLPALLFAMVLVTLFSPSLVTIALAIGVVSWPQTARLYGGG